MNINKTKQNKTLRRCYTEHRRGSVVRGIALVVLLTFSSSEIFPAVFISSKAYAQTILNLPIPGTMVEFTPPLTPPLLIGLKIHPEHPLKFDFLLDRGDVKKLDGSELKNESTRLIKYFLAALTIPEKDLWVNLSPYEKSRIIPQNFGITDMGRDLLAEDYIDWGQQEKFATAIGVGECAGVMIDLVATLILEAEEKLAMSEECLENKSWADGIYHAYASFVHTAKALLLQQGVQCNTQHGILKDFDTHFSDKGLYIPGSFKTVSLKSVVLSRQFFLRFADFRKMSTGRISGLVCFLIPWSSYFSSRSSIRSI